MDLYVFSDITTGDKYLFICRDDLDKFIKMYGCAYYDEQGCFPQEGKDYTFDSLDIVTPQQAIADYKGR
jgi:hypothetical protein